jgi:glycogen(starch) synthase
VKILMLAMSGIVQDARVLREARTLRDAGHHVVVLGLRGFAAAPPPDDLDVRLLGASSAFPRADRGRRRSAVTSLARWLLLPTHVRMLERSFATAAMTAVRGEGFDVVHAHDFDTLAVAREIARVSSARIVYDSHECWVERRHPGRPTPLADRTARRRERQWGREADAVITVGEGLRDVLRHRYGWDHVTVVRNSFPPLDGAAPAVARLTGLVYAGRIGGGRDLETLTRAASQLRHITPVLVGPQDERWVARHDLQDLDVQSAVPIDDVDRLYQIHGLAFVSVSDGPLNHRMALPNKLFQAVRAGVPVVATDLPEIRRVVTKHAIGTLYRAGDPDSLAAAVHAVAAEYHSYVEAVHVARQHLSWDVDARRLLGVYAPFARPHEGGAGSLTCDA